MADISTLIASALINPYVTGQQSAMPFPNNHNPDMDFANRWPAQLPPSGIVNDMRPQIDSGPALMRKLLANGR